MKHLVQQSNKTRQHSNAAKRLRYIETERNNINKYKLLNTDNGFKQRD